MTTLLQFGKEELTLQWLTWSFSDLRKRHVENCHVQSQISPKAPTKTQLPLPPVESPLSTSAWLEILMETPAQLNAASVVSVRASLNNDVQILKLATSRLRRHPHQLSKTKNHRKLALLVSDFQFLPSNSATEFRYS